MTDLAARMAVHFVFSILTAPLRGHADPNQLNLGMSRISSMGDT
jgi:hypothetical protein